MSEEIKDIILDVKDSLNETPKNMYKYNKITLNLNEFEEILNYIEQLEKEIDRLNNIIKELSKDVDMWNKKYNEQFNIITELEKWLEEKTYGMNEIHTYKIGALEDEVILNKLKALKENK